MTKVTADRRHRRIMAERTKRFPRSEAERVAARNRVQPAVPLHILAAEWTGDDETRERPLDLPPITKKTPRRKRKRGSESSDGSEAEMLRRGKDARLSRKRQKQAEEEQARRRRGSVSDESEDWEASGDSSGGMTTSDEDEPPAARTPVIVLSEDSEDEPMDVDVPSGDQDEDMEEADVVPLELVGGDDALDSGDEADDEPADDEPDRSAELVGGDDALDSDNEPGHDAADESDSKADESDGAIDGKSDREDNKSDDEVHEPDTSAEGLVGGDDALDSSSDRHAWSPLPNGHASSSRSPEPATRLPNGSLSPHKSPNGHSGTQRSSSVPHAPSKKVNSDSDDSHAGGDDHFIGVAAQLSQQLPASDDSEEDSRGSSGGANGWSGAASPSPADEDDAPDGGLLGGDDALDSDSD
jgi:hypothetical protein